MLRRKKKYIRWQIKYFTNFFFFNFLIGTTMQIYSSSQHGSSYNIIYFHVPMAWASVIIYFYITYRYMLYVELNIFHIFVGIWYTFYTLLSGFIWGYLVFGKFFSIDLKIFTYFLLFLTLIAIYWTLNTLYPNLMLISGLYFYIESRFSVTYLNTLHQSFLIDYYTTQHWSDESRIFWLFSDKHILFLCTFCLLWQTVFLNVRSSYWNVLK